MAFNPRVYQRSEYRCVKCKDCFFRKERYDQHMKEFHKGNEKVEKCKLCEIGFPYRPSFIRHISSANHKNNVNSTFCHRNWIRKRLSEYAK